MASTEIPDTSEASTSQELLARIEKGWTHFRSAVAAAGLPALEERTSAGWTYKELLAHIAAWEETIPPRLAAEGFPYAVGDADAFNAAAAASARERRPAEVVRRLDLAHAALVAAVGRIADRDIGEPTDFLAGNSYDHYEEHRDELLVAVPTTPAALVAKVRAEWVPFRGALARIGLVPLGERTASGWTQKALLTHIGRWMEHVPLELGDRLAGRPTARVDVEALNAQATADAGSRTAHEVVEALDGAYRAARDAIQALPADTEIPLSVAYFVASETYEHFGEHQSELDAAVPRTAGQLVARMEAAWRPFREAVRDRGRAGLGHPTATGWAYKDVVAHTIGWLQEAVKELRTREFTRWDSPSIDAQNARTVLARKLVGPEALLDELDTSYRSFVAAVRSLSDADLVDDQVFGAAAFYGHLHWEHHFSELGVKL